MLTDFRIENDNVIMLSFSNGSKYRVNEPDLAQFLSLQDLAKVKKAMAKRHTFMKRVLPPTAVILLASGIMTAGAGDVQHLMLLRSKTSTYQASDLVQPQSVSNTAASSVTSAPADSRATALSVAASQAEDSASEKGRSSSKLATGGPRSQAAGSSQGGRNQSGSKLKGFGSHLH